MNDVPDTSPDSIPAEVPLPKVVNLPGAPKPLPVPPEARAIQRRIAELLDRLSRLEFFSCLDPRFLNQWLMVVSMADDYQRTIARHAGMTAACSPGCAHCCFHWVEDVNSFEAEIIAAHIRREYPDHIPALIDRCNRDSGMLERLNDLVEAKLATADPSDGARKIDPVDLLLASFHRLRRQCPLLDKKGGTCMVYQYRPLTCRMYVSFSSPSRCDPGHEGDHDVPTYLFDLEEPADGIIDALHFKFLRFEGITGLRPLLSRYLS